jgi:hypothetical protein
LLLSVDVRYDISRMDKIWDAKRKFPDVIAVHVATYKEGYVLHETYSFVVFLLFIVRKSLGTGTSQTREHTRYVPAIVFQNLVMGSISSTGLP